MWQHSRRVHAVLLRAVVRWTPCSYAPYRHVSCKSIADSECELKVLQLGGEECIDSRRQGSVHCWAGGFAGQQPDIHNLAGQGNRKRLDVCTHQPMGVVSFGLFSKIHAESCAPTLKLTGTMLRVFLQSGPPARCTCLHATRVQGSGEGPEAGRQVLPPAYKT